MPIFHSHKRAQIVFKTLFAVVIISTLLCLVLDNRTSPKSHASKVTRTAAADTVPLSQTPAPTPNGAVGRQVWRINDDLGGTLLKLDDNGQFVLLQPPVQNCTTFDTSTDKKYEIRAADGTSILLQLMLTGNDQGKLRLAGAFFNDNNHPPSDQHHFYIKNTRGVTLLSLDDSGNLYLAGTMVIVGTNDTQLTYFIDGANGDDNNIGDFDHPFKTIGQAQSVLRATRTGNDTSQHEMHREIFVYLRAGRYETSAGNSPDPENCFTFTSADSGNNSHHVTWCAFPGDKVVLSGGRVLDNSKFQACGNGLYSYQLTSNDGFDASKKSMWFRDIYINGRRGVLARWPNKKFGGYDPYQNPDGYNQAAITYDKSDYQYDDNPNHYAVISDAQIIQTDTNGQRYNSAEMTSPTLQMQNSMAPRQMFGGRQVVPQPTTALNMLNGAQIANTNEKTEIGISPDIINASPLQNVLNNLDANDVNRPYLHTMSGYATNDVKIQSIASKNNLDYIIFSNGRHPTTLPYWYQRMQAMPPYDSVWWTYLQQKIWPNDPSKWTWQDPTQADKDSSLWRFENMALFESQGGFYIENALGLLDDPGEWFLQVNADNSSTLYYKPYSEEISKDGKLTANIEIPVSRRIVDINGVPNHYLSYTPITTGGENDVQNLRFENLTFQDTLPGHQPNVAGLSGEDDWGLSGYDSNADLDGEGDPEDGFEGYASSEWYTFGVCNDFAAQVTTAKDVDFNKCVFQNLGSCGLGYLEQSQDCDAQGNVFHDIDGGAIIVDQDHNVDRRYPTNVYPELGSDGTPVLHGDDQLPNFRTDYPFETMRGYGINNQIENNDVTRTGYEFPYGAISINGTESTTIANNDIEYVARDGIFVGFWSFFRDLKDITINNNLINHAGALMTEAGGIYVCRCEQQARNFNYPWMSDTFGSMEIFNPQWPWANGPQDEKDGFPDWTPTLKNERAAITSGRDYNGNIIDRMTFFANASIIHNRIQNMPAIDVLGDSIHGPFGIYIDHTACGRPGLLRPAPDDSASMLNVQENDCIAIGANAKDIDLKMQECHDLLPDDTSPEDHAIYGYGHDTYDQWDLKMINGNNPIKQQYPAHLMDVFHDGVGIFNRSGWALWHEEYKPAAGTDSNFDTYYQSEIDDLTQCGQVHDPRTLAPNPGDPDQSAPDTIQNILQDFRINRRNCNNLTIYDPDNLQNIIESPAQFDAGLTSGYSWIKNR